MKKIILFLLVVLGISSFISALGMTENCSCVDNQKDYYNEDTSYILCVLENGTEYIPEGSVSYSNTDVCENSNQLREYYCDDNRENAIGSEVYQCEIGCEDGACKSLSENTYTLHLNEETEIEFNNNPYILSVEKISTYSAMIKIVNKNIPVEYLSYTVGINSDFSFKDVVINLIKISSESVEVFLNENKEINCGCVDNGMDYYKKNTASIVCIHPNGTEFIPTGSVSYSNTDVCEGTNQLRKYYCHKDRDGIGSINYWCLNGCEDGACKKISPEEDTEIINIEEKIESIEDESVKEELKKEDLKVFCSGCVLDKKCYPYGFRNEENFCSDNNDEFILQKSSNDVCNNNFECNSNLCINDECVSGSVWAKFLRWFSRLFGGK